MDAAIPIVNENDRETVEKVLLFMRQNQSPEYEFVNGLMKQIENMGNEIRELNSRLGELKDQIPKEKSTKDKVEEVYGRLSERGKGILQKIQDFIGHLAQKGREWLASIQQKGKEKLHSFLEGIGIKEKLEDLQKGFKENISGLEKDIQRLDSIESEFRQTGMHLKNAFRIIGGREEKGIETEVKSPHIFAKVPRLMLKAYKGMSDRVNRAIQAYDRLENSVNRNAAIPDKELRRQPEPGMEKEKQGGAALEDISRQTMESHLAAVSKNGLALQYVKEQTPEICMEAVRNDGLALQYVKEQTPEVCMAAVKKSGWALQYVKEQTPEICMAAVMRHGLALQYVEEQTPEVCMAAVMENDGSPLQHVKEQTPEICMAAVKKSGFALQHVKEQTPEICMAAVKEYGLALQYVKEQTPEICMEAVKNDSRALRFVKVRIAREYLQIMPQTKEQFKETIEFLKQNGGRYDPGKGERGAWYIPKGKIPLEELLAHRVEPLVNEKQMVTENRSSVLDKLNQNKNEIKENHEKENHVKQKQQETER